MTRSDPNPTAHRKGGSSGPEGGGGRTKRDIVALARQTLEKDSGCTEAQLVLALEEATSHKQLVAQIQIIVDRAEAKLGTPFLREHRGHLWDIEEAHPYLHARLALTEAMEKAGKPAAAVPHLTELLEIDPHDHLEARFRLIRCLLAANDLKTLAQVLKEREGDRSAFIAWAAVLERVRSGRSADKALARARAINPFFEEFLTGQRKLPKRIPTDPAPGSPEEAASALKLFGNTWMNSREGMYWLFRQG